MKITFKKSRGIILESNNNTSILCPLDGYSGSKREDYKVVLSVNKELYGSGFEIQEPGEFEYKSIIISAQSSGLGEVPDVYEVVVDDICILFLKKDFKYTQLVHDSLGNIDILVSEISDSEKIEDLILKFDPEVFIPMFREENFKRILENAGISNFQDVATYKTKSEKFGSDGFVLETLIF